MAMEILQPRDCLVNPFQTHPSHVFPLIRNSKSNRSVRKQVSRSERKRNGSTKPRRSKSDENFGFGCGKINSASGLVSGNVRILKRGESLDSQIRSLEIKNKKKENVAMMLCGAGRLGPEPDDMPKEEMKAFLTGRRDVYAGSVFVISPSPNDLPLPSFHQKKLQLTNGNYGADDLATRNIRRLLGLK